MYEILNKTCMQHFVKVKIALLVHGYVTDVLWLASVLVKRWQQWKLKLPNLHMKASPLVSKRDLKEIVSVPWDATLHLIAVLHLHHSYFCLQWYFQQMMKNVHAGSFLPTSAMTHPGFHYNLMPIFKSNESSGSKCSNLRVPGHHW